MEGETQQKLAAAAHEENTTDWLLENYKLVEKNKLNSSGDEDEDVILELESGVEVSIPQQRRPDEFKGSLIRKRKNEEEIDLDLSGLFSGRLLRAAGRLTVHTKTKKKRANHFFAIQISNDEIHAAIRTVQDSVIAKEPLLKKALIALSTLHITLAVTHLANEKDVQRARQALSDTGMKLKEHLESQPLEIHFQQVGHFQNKVVFADIHNKVCLQRLQHVVNVLKEQCEGCGLPMEEDNFVPHLTMFKLSKDPSLRKKGLKTISPSLYKEHAKTIFGKEVTRSIQLLSMNDPKDKHGYYANRGEFHFEVSDLQAAPSAEEVAAELRRQSRKQIRKLLKETMANESIRNEQSSGTSNVA